MNNEKIILFEEKLSTPASERLAKIVNSVFTNGM